MNAESTPVRENLNEVFSDDIFSELTPIKKKLSQEESKLFRKGLREENVNRNGKRKHLLRHVSQKRKRDEVVQKITTCSDSDIVNDSCLNKSSDASTSDLDNYLSNLIYKVVEKSPERIYENNETKVINDSNNSKSRDLLGSFNKNESLNKPNQTLTVSDIMKWNDDSLLPNERSNLAEQIKKKLLENINKKEIYKSQTTGWTQFSFSRIEAANENRGFRELGPFYGLPLEVQKLYEEHKGIKELYSWQQECLDLEAVKQHKNLVYALPTSGGKTLVAEILILREILCHNKNVLFILPFVSIVQEKIRDFSPFALELGFLVEEYAAGKGVIPPRKRRRRNTLLIATIEKALVVVNSLIEMNKLNEFGLIVVDELHLLAEEGRGATLETLLTQILYIEEKIQVIGMTATIGNLNEIAKFLKAESYTGNFRPVELTEYIKCENKIYKVDTSSENLMTEVRNLHTVNERDPDGICHLVEEVIPNDSVLIFCATKKNCENVALLLCRLLPRSLLKHKEEEKRSLYKALVTETNNQICPTLNKTIFYGVAYHHSGLTAGERKLLEESFRAGTLSVICCTSTLAAGVNLPAKRVILRSPFVGIEFINLSRYKQMVGRAGRTGLGSAGESYLICQMSDLPKVGKLFSSQMDEVISKMNGDSCKELILSAIGLNIATTRKTLKEMMGYSLLNLQASKVNKDSDRMTDACIIDLYKQGALKIKNVDSSNSETSDSKLDINSSQEKKMFSLTNESSLIVSRLGRAAMKGGMSLEKAHELYSNLKKAQASLVLLTSLHLLYLVTPYDLVTQIKPNFSVYFNVYMQLDSKELHTAKIIGINEYVISRLATGHKPKNIEESILNRFYVSLILNELWKQQSIWDVAVLFQLPRGLIQTLMMSAATFANSVLRFCEELEELWSFKSLLNEFAPRLVHCCTAELLPLMDLPAVKRGRAKQLYDAGFKTLQHLANAKSSDLVRSVDHLSNKVAAQIIAAAKLMLMEKAENLKEEAEEVLEGIAEKYAPAET